MRQRGMSVALRLDLHASGDKTKRTLRLTHRDEALTPRELEELALAASGKEVPEIARRRALSIETIKSRRRLILAKLGARNVTHAVALAYEAGILPTAQQPALAPVAIDARRRRTGRSP